MFPNFSGSVKFSTLSSNDIKQFHLQVDGTVETGLAKKHDINAYPTIKAWVGGHERKYESGRTAKDFVEWVGQHTGHPVTHLKTHKELMSFKYDHFVFAVGFFADPETQAAKHFEAIATVYRHQFTFCAVYDPEIAKEEEVTTPGLVLYKHFDDKKEVMTDGFHEEGMMDFIQGHSFPIFDQVTPKNFKNYYMRGLPIAWLFVNADFETDTKNAKAVVREIALQHRGKFSMVWMDGTKQDNLMKQLGLTGTKLPSFTIDAGDKFPMSEANDITTDTITEHMAGYHANTLTAFHRSVAAPETPLVDGLTTLVGSTVKDAMYDEASDVLLLLHHGSDDESKALLPVWTALGHEFLKLDNIVIAQIDIAVNDAPNKVLPGGYPRVYLIKAGTNEVCG